MSWISSGLMGLSGPCWVLEPLSNPAITSTTTAGLPWGWLGKELWRDSRTPQHPCRFPWKLVHGRILPQGLLEEILEGHLTMQPFLSPKDRGARKGTAGSGCSQPQGGRGPALQHLVQPTCGHFPPGSWPAPLLCLQNPETQWEQRGESSRTLLGQRQGHSQSSTGEMLPLKMLLCTSQPRCAGIPPARREMWQREISQQHPQAALLLLPALPCPQGPSPRGGARQAGWQQVMSPHRGDRLGAGLPCYCSRLFSSGEAAGPAGCHQPGTAWPILNRLHKESAAPARIFSELYLSKRSAGREGGRAGGGGAAPGLFCRQQLTCTAVVWAGMVQRGCWVQHPAWSSPQIPQEQPKSWRGQGQSIKARILPVKAADTCPQAKLSIPRAGSSVVPEARAKQPPSGKTHWEPG